MARTLDVRFDLALRGLYNDNTDLSVVAERIAYTFTSLFTNGTGDDQANAIFASRVTLNALTSYDLDAGTVVDSMGNALAFSAIKALIVQNRHTVSGEYVTVLGNFITTNFGGATTQVRVNPYGFFLLCDPKAGWPCNGATKDMLILNPLATPMIVDLIVIGVAT